MPRKRSKPIPYTGIAALITAVGGVIVSFYTMDQKQNDSELTVESVLNYSKALETRVTALERVNRASKPWRYAQPPENWRECQIDVDCAPGYVCKEGHCVPATAGFATLHGDSITIEHGTSETVSHKPEPNFRAIQKFIRENKKAATF